MDNSSVRVAVRVRPQSSREKIDACRVCTSACDNQITIGSDKSFTYDYLYDLDSTQQQIYEQTSKSLVEGTFNGYNATIFAYGQTGSGKTYTMGTGFDVSYDSIDSELMGIVPRAVAYLFEEIERKEKLAIEEGKTVPDFKVLAQFIEIYYEDIIDLLDVTRDPNIKTKSKIKIHENANGEILTMGATTKPVKSKLETMTCLRNGALSRTTASTNMNSQSSRSHAIFTLYVRQQRVTDDEDGNDVEILTSKFHFVDLAGSERLKRTKATGHRAREGISINCGLLSLGNVISALGDTSRKISHVPYRDSKLTRLLQDSLGGNSRTLMIACVSPSDRDFMETLNTLKYANRARNIKNVISVNQDKTSLQIALLKREIAELQLKLEAFKGNNYICEDTAKIRSLKDTIDKLNIENSEMISNKILYPLLDDPARDQKMEEIVNKYVLENETLRSQLFEREKQLEHRQSSRDLLDIAKIDLYTSKNRSSLINLEISARLRNGSSATANAAEDAVKRSEVSSAGQMRRRCRKQHHHHRRHRLHHRRNHHQHSTTGGGGGGANEKPRPTTAPVHAADPETTSPLGDERACGSDPGELATPTLATPTHRRGSHDTTTSQADSRDMYMDSCSSCSFEASSAASEGTATASGSCCSSSASSSSFDDDDDDGSQLSMPGLSEDLADLTSDISIKEKLIRELEMSRRRIETMKSQYESKVQILLTKISTTEKERDEIIENLGKQGPVNQNVDKIQDIKKKYELRITEMKGELKRMGKHEKEQAKIIRNKLQKERELANMHNELRTMKTQKVKLMNQIKAETVKTLDIQKVRNTETHRHKRQIESKDTKIRNLEAMTLKKDMFLKRKHDEIEALKKKTNNVRSRIVKARGNRNQGLRNHGNAKTPRFSAKSAKSKWDRLEDFISESITKKRTQSCLENDMQIWIKQRSKLSRELEKIKNDVNCEKDKSLKENMNYVQEKINECQDNIVEFEHSRVPDIDCEYMLKDCELLEESKYLLKHSIQLTMNKGALATQYQHESRELKAKLHQERQDCSLQREIIEYLVESHPLSPDIAAFNLQQNNDYDSDSSNAVDLYDSITSYSPLTCAPLTSLASPVGTSSTPPCTLAPLSSSVHAGESSSTSTSSTTAAAASSSTATHTTPNTPTHKARRHTKTTDNMLYDVCPPTASPTNHQQQKGVAKSSAGMNGTTASASPSTAASSSSSYGLHNNFPPPTQSTAMPTPHQHHHQYQQPPQNLATSASAYNNSYEQRPPSTTTTGSSNSSLSLMNDSQDKMRNSSDVFSRLQTSPASPNPSRGVISDNAQKSCNQSLIQTHIATGHSKSILSLYATESLLFSSSKDRTCKQWDLTTGLETLCLTGHHSNVTTITARESLIYTASAYYVQLWDSRIGNRSIKTYTSAGFASEDPCGKICPPSETTINDMALNSDGNIMYTAAGNNVKIWDLKCDKAVGKLSGGHQSAIMVLAVDDMDTANGNICIVTGSKDHYIKVFEVCEDTVGLQSAQYNLEPPHYDGIQSLCLLGDLLFSGSRDMCIKKWDLSSQCLKQSINGAHKDWICGLALLPDSQQASRVGDCLLSGCRSGVLKIWSIGEKNCQQLCELDVLPKRHALNTITTNNELIFTGSSDIGIWKPNFDELNFKAE